MTIEPTSSAAYSAVNASGAAETQRARLVQALRQHGPMAMWEICQALPGHKNTSLHARLRELQQADIVGTMHCTSKDPDTGRDGEVMGLRDEHGAFRYFPQDSIAIRLYGVTHTLKFDLGELPNLPMYTLGNMMVTAITTLLGKVDHDNARRESKRLGKEGTQATA